MLPRFAQGVTELKVVTDGCLLREVLSDPLLTSYSVIVVDDVQQRSASTDVLLGLLRKAWLIPCVRGAVHTEARLACAAALHMRHTRGMRHLRR